MSNQVSAKSGTSRARDAVSSFAAVIACGLVMSAPAFAQTPPPAAPAPAAPAAAPAAAKEAPKAAAPAAAAPAAGGAAEAKTAENQGSWVKLCDKVASNTKDKDGKDVKVEKNVCATFHDTVDSNTGQTVVSTGVREIEGDAKPDFQVSVPLGMVIPAGVRVAVLNKEQFEKALKNEELDPKTVKSVDLKFTACLPTGCQAEMEAPQDLLDQMKTGGALLVRSVYVTGQPFSVPVPLAGFEKALSGKAIDTAVYKKARNEMMSVINARLAEKFAKFKAEQGKNLPPPPGFKEGEAVTADKKPAGAPAAKP